MSAPTPPPRTVVLQWQLSSVSGWGINGLQLALCWARGGRIQAFSGYPCRRAELALSPLEALHIEPFIGRTETFLQQVAGHAGQELTITLPVLWGLGNDLVGGIGAEGTVLRGQPTIGICYLENTDVTREGRERADRLSCIVAGSTFVENVLRGVGVERVRTVLQGVDPTLFHPAPKTGWFGDRFVVFSGGKAEFRKGQDLVLLAFRAFAERHPDALLLTAWHSPWPQLARSLEASPAVAPVRFHDDGRIDAVGWAVANGIEPGQVLDLGMIPNTEMPRILREVDVGLFPNRCEGGTNLVAMECMACGVPAILSANSGHLDLIRAGNCLPLTRQRPIVGNFGSAGWGQSDVDEIVAALETLWSDRDAARRIGQEGAAFMSTLPWQQYADGIAAVVDEVA